jgi:hypothetical protein
VADEPVVVIKVRPMKASNGLRDKTRPTVGSVFNTVRNTQKVLSVEKGGSVLISVCCSFFEVLWTHNFAIRRKHLLGINGQ